MAPDDNAANRFSLAPASGLGDGTAFLSSLLAGMLLGYLVDRWLDTYPVALLVGFGLGAYAGFVKLWAMSKRAEEESRDR